MSKKNTPSHESRGNACEKAIGLYAKIGKSHPHSLQPVPSENPSCGWHVSDACPLVRFGLPPCCHLEPDGPSAGTASRRSPDPLHAVIGEALYFTCRQVGFPNAKPSPKPNPHSRIQSALRKKLPVPRGPFSISRPEICPNLPRSHLMLRENRATPCDMPLPTQPHTRVAHLPFA